MKKITWRWLVNSFGVVLLIVVVMVIAIAVSVHSYYYNGARQFLLSRSDSVATLLENYSKDSSADFPSSCAGWWRITSTRTAPS